MTIHLLTELLDSTERLIANLQDACARVCRPAPDDDPDAGHLICDLAEQGSVLQQRVAALRVIAPHRHDSIAAATIGAIEDLLTLLFEAHGEFVTGNEAGGYGALTLFDRYAGDLKAACQLRARALRRGS